MRGLSRDNQIPWKSVLGMGAQAAVRPQVAVEEAPVGGHNFEYAAIDLEVRIAWACKARGLFLHIWHIKHRKIRYGVCTHEKRARSSKHQEGILWLGECTESGSANSENYHILAQLAKEMDLGLES